MLNIIEYENAPGTEYFEVMTEKTAIRNSYEPMRRIANIEREANIMAGRSHFEMSGGFDFDEYRKAATALNAKLDELPKVDRHTALTIALNK